MGMGMGMSDSKYGMGMGDSKYGMGMDQRLDGNEW